MPAVGMGFHEIQSLERLPARPVQHRIELKKHIAPVKVLVIQTAVAEEPARPDVPTPANLSFSVYRFFSYLPPLTTSAAGRGPPELS
jgi:hypothetical protein